MRQLRGDSESDVRSNLGDLLVQQARLSSGSRISFPFDDAEGDMIIRSPGEGNPIPPFQNNLIFLRDVTKGEKDGDASNPKAMENAKKRKKTTVK